VTEPGAELAAVHTAITELAAIVVNAKAALGDDGRAGKSTSSHPLLEMSVGPCCGWRGRSGCRTVRSSPSPDGRADRVVEHPDKDNANWFSLPATHDERRPVHGTREKGSC
jgi:hypothetical protein